MSIQAIKGVKDILPQDMPVWQYLEATARKLFEDYGFTEIRVPVFEYTELFARSIGASTDIVEKEMYTFEDRDGRRSPSGRKGPPAWCARSLNTNCMPMPSLRSCITSAPCSGMSGRRKAGIASSTRSGLRRSDLTIPMSISRSWRCCTHCSPDSALPV